MGLLFNPVKIGHQEKVLKSKVAAALSQICVWKYAPEQKRVLLKNN